MSISPSEFWRTNFTKQFVHWRWAVQFSKQGNILWTFSFDNILLIGVEVFIVSVFLAISLMSTIFSFASGESQCRNLHPSRSKGQKVLLSKYLHRFVVVSFVWIPLCFSNLQLTTKVLPHSSQLKLPGSPWVSSMWLSKSQYLTNVASQISHFFAVLLTFLRF